MIPQLYKSLLIQHAQNVWKQRPGYHTVNEGSGHAPKFRCTVMVDGVSYTSPDTFQQRKAAEMDASRIAYFDLLQKLKNEALCLLREDKSLYKSILADFAAKMYMQKPAYQTAHVNTLPVFNSSLVFGDVSCTGDICRRKKEAEQSVARAVILKYIDSESGIKLSEIIKSKYKNYTKAIDNANAVSFNLINILSY
nr:double-stranded RNA-binding [Tanacetum cinerariifolium]